MTSDRIKNKGKILIVEDNAVFMQTLRDFLYSRFPYLTIEEAVDGKEALQKVNDFLPDLIFMDIKLPGESGLDLTKKIKISHPDTIIIILTNYDLPEYREAVRRKGANHFFVKGSSTAGEISEVVESLLSKQRRNSAKKDQG